MKKCIRTFVNRRIDRLTKASIEKKSHLIFENLTNSTFLDKGEFIGVYCAKDNEVQTSNLIQCLLQSGKRVFAPRVAGNSLNFHEI